MSARKLAADRVGLPRFMPITAGDADVFALSSHRRAREALEFGLGISEPGFNLFVVGEDRSGRMTATVAFLRQAMADRPPPPDWIYLNNFRAPHRPRHFRLPAGVGRRFCRRMAAFLPALREALGQAFGSEDYQNQVRARGEAVTAEIGQRLNALRAAARRHGLDLVQSPQGAAMVVAATPESGPQPEPPAEVAKQLADELHEINRWASARQAEFAHWVQDINRRMADQAIGGLVDALQAEFGQHRGLARWLTEMRVDVIEGMDRFRRSATAPAEGEIEPDLPERRYAVNLLVDHADDAYPVVVVEANPSYENLFGRIEYRQVKGALRTDFSLIRAGALHRANGGVLVLRAEALAADPTVWGFLKAALRDREIRIEELHRSGGVPIAGTARPKPIPLDLKVVIVGAPRWYFAFFSVDPDFQTHFKVKADIDSDMEATPDNLACYAGLIEKMAVAHAASCEEAAIDRLLGIAARWAGRRDRLTARFELIDDLVAEAAALVGGPSPRRVTKEAVALAMAKRRQRNARIEDKVQESIRQGFVMIDTEGAVVGQINALTVRDVGDHQFGAPSRVTARASIGRMGIINIEREAALGGPIQQKGVMMLQGFLAGRFARRLPLSFNCSVTFEQSYGGVEGDSAMVAELLAILSDLADLPLRQDLAVTGSVNQRGQVQAIGGLHHKVEGFFRTCEATSPNRRHGVAVPSANEISLVLRDEVAEAVAAGRFEIWSIDTIEAAIELFMGVPAGAPDREGEYPPDTVYGRVLKQLAAFDAVLAARPPG